jgi:hypothetical protein
MLPPLPPSCQRAAAAILRERCQSASVIELRRAPLPASYDTCRLFLSAADVFADDVDTPLISDYLLFFSCCKRHDAEKIAMKARTRCLPPFAAADAQRERRAEAARRRDATGTRRAIYARVRGNVVYTFYAADAGSPCLIAFAFISLLIRAVRERQRCCARAAGRAPCTRVDVASRYAQRAAFRASSPRYARLLSTAPRAADYAL